MFLFFEPPLRDAELVFLVRWFSCLCKNMYIYLDIECGLVDTRFLLNLFPNSSYFSGCLQPLFSHSHAKVRSQTIPRTIPSTIPKKSPKPFPVYPVYEISDPLKHAQDFRKTKTFRTTTTTNQLWCGKRNWPRTIRAPLGSQPRSLGRLGKSLGLQC